MEDRDDFAASPKRNASWPSRNEDYACYFQSLYWNKKKKYLNTELFCLCSTVGLVGNIYYDEKFLWLSIWPIRRFFCQQICSTCAIFTIFNIYNATMPCMIWGGGCSFYVIQRYWPSHKFPAEMGKTILCVSLRILMIPN